MTPQEVESHIRHTLIEFQIGDLEKAMQHAKTNFLVALGLMTATEFMGGLLTGTLGLHKRPKGQTSRQSLEETRFEEGFKNLGDSYQQLLTSNKGGVLDIYTNIRCGLVHQYLPTQTSEVTAGKSSGPGIKAQDGQFVIMVDDYIDDLRRAADRLLGDIKSNAKLLAACTQALSQIPDLK